MPRNGEPYTTYNENGDIKLIEGMFEEIQDDEIDWANDSSSDVENQQPEQDENVVKQSSQNEVFLNDKNSRESNFSAAKQEEIKVCDQNDQIQSATVENDIRRSLVNYVYAFFQSDTVSDRDAGQKQGVSDKPFSWLRLW